MRITLTKKETLSSIGAELLELCATTTADGSLSDEEIEQLRIWLEKNRGKSLPAITFLSQTVNRIIADRRITREERRELHAALERVLPKELRDGAQERRRKAEVEQAARDAAETAKYAPAEMFDFMVAGVHYENRGPLIRKYVRADQYVYLVRDLQNKYSPNAVKVVLREGPHIGFVPEEDAERMAPLLDRGCKQAATVKKILTGGRVPIPVILADIFPPDTQSGIAYDVPQLLQVFTSAEPCVQEAMKPGFFNAPVGCLTVIFGMIIFLLIRLMAC